LKRLHQQQDTAVFGSVL